MGLFFIDQSDSKDAVRGLIRDIHTLSQRDSDPDKLSEQSKVVLDRIEALVVPWNVDTLKFMNLLKSQIYSGNTKGALRLVDIIPPRRVTPLSLVCAVAFSIAVTAIIYHLRF